MRTYTRKRPEYQYIEDVNELCRLCLEKCEDNIQIFENSNNVCATIAMRIMICVGLEMSQEECLPNMICKECFKELERYYRFRKKCEVSYQKLKSHLHATRERDVNKALNVANEGNIENVDEEILSVCNMDPTKLMLTFNENEVVAVKMLDFNSVDSANADEDVKLEVRPEKIENNDKQIQIEVPGQIESLSDENQNPVISEFLSTILINLGILAQHDNGLSVLDPDMKTLTLETGDGEHINLELIEEDDVEEPVEEDIVIKYMTSNYVNSKGKAAIPTINKNGAAGVVGVVGVVGAAGGAAWCATCGQWLSSGRALARHARLHSGERPHQCRVCQRRFAQKEVMLRHLLVHDEVRPFQCASCPKSFTQRGALLAHARTHSPPQRRALALHRCVRCPKVFLYASGLSRHMMMHNGRVYVCGACERHFNDQSSLMRHLNSAKHPAAPQPADDNTPPGETAT